jgi:hypothetical protein
MTCIKVVGAIYYFLTHGTLEARDLGQRMREKKNK